MPPHNGDTDHTLLRGNFYPEAGTNVQQCIGKAAADAAAHAKPPFHEKAPNEAFEIMQPGEYVFVPQALDVRQGEISFNLGGASTKYKAAYDGFPGACVHYPWAKPQWHSALFWWIHGAGMDFADLASDVGLCMSLWMDTEYSVVPASFKRTYIFLTLFTIAMEIVIAAIEVNIRDSHYLQKVRRRYGRVTLWSSAVKSLFLRYTLCPFQVDNAARLFANEKSGWNLGATYELPFERERSRAMHDYSGSINFLTKTPKIIIEDCILLALNLFMMHAMKTTTAGGLISAFFSVYCFVNHIMRSCRYILSVRRLTRSLRARMAQGDSLAQDDPRGHITTRDTFANGSGSDQLHALLAHPIRRWIAGSVRT